MADPFASELVRLEELVRTLRARCPWDREQTHKSLTRYLLEEAYEALEAIEELGPDGEGYEHLEEELGDVLFQVVFHSVLAAEQGQFALGDVARNVHDKLVGRHPHVFGDVVAKTPDDVLKNWELIKKREKGQASVMDEVARNLPALLYAHKIQRKAASVGFDWDNAGGALEKVGEELTELTRRWRPNCGATASGDERVRDERGARRARGPPVRRRQRGPARQGRPGGGVARGHGQVPPAFSSRRGSGGRARARPCLRWAWLTLTACGKR